MTALVIHGHFYQPPRENPWTGLIDAEPSAYPFHDWNERVHAECYRANAYARVIDHYGLVERIGNNYADISFNMGPTLLSWMQLKDPETYARVLEADRLSVKAHGGHGNAIAQAYNHCILPLCNDRDRRTQVRWGMADFRLRFGREPASMWLPETACNDATLGTLIDEGLQYVILSPHQAQRVRRVGDSQWHDVSSGSVDPGVAYRCMHPDGSGRSIAIFFYDGNIARALAFESALASSQAFVHQLTSARGGPGRLVHVATDGESYGHHTRAGERGLAYALQVEAQNRGFKPTNYGVYLAAHPPTMEVEIKPGPNGEGTAWSCAHGVGRWYRDCGCETGGRQGWNQQWRGPLREALDHLRDYAAGVFERLGAEFFLDPWRARDGYIDVILEPERRGEWLNATAGRTLEGTARVRALTLLELQRNAQLMYTSCGWFFTELSGIETVQVLKYAARALDHLDDLGVDSPRAGFLERLGRARSNLPEHGTGVDIFQRFAEPSRVPAQRVAVSLAVSSLMGEPDSEGEHAGYTYQRTHFHKEQHGRLTMATGRLQLENVLTGRTAEYARLSLHLGGVDFYCALRPDLDPAAFGQAAESLWARFRTSSIPELLRLAHDTFGPEEHGLTDVLEDSRRVIADLVYGEVVGSLIEDYERVYRQNRRIIEMLEEAGIELPPELQAVAELALTHRLEAAIREAQQSRTPAAFAAVVAQAEHTAKRGHRQLRLSTRHLLASLVGESVRQALEDDKALDTALGLLKAAEALSLTSTFERAQEAVYARLATPTTRPGLLRLGEALRLAPRR